VRKPDTIVTIPPGYYNLCELDKIFSKYGIKIENIPYNGKIQVFRDTTQITHLPTRRKYIKFLLWRLGPGLSDMLGYPRDFTEIIKEPKLAPSLPNWAKYKELFVHLDCISTTHNIILGGAGSIEGSTVLRTVPVKSEEINCGRVVRFTNYQYKQLLNGFISNVKIDILNTDKQAIDLWYITLILHLRGL
jgi:hypothetical protein